MKNSIETLLNGVVHDNAQVIKENGGNAAEYIILTAEAADQGWQEFLSDEEAEEYEKVDANRREEIRNEIRAFVNENYNYNLLENELLEKWIIVEMMNVEDESKFRVTRRSNFEKMDYCKAYDNGIQVDCNNAGCYSFNNTDSDIFTDLYNEVSEKFGLTMDEMDRLNLSTTRELYEMLIEPAGSKCYNVMKADLPAWDDVVAFFKTWRDANEIHTAAKAWVYHDSHNFESVVLESDLGEYDCLELEKEEQIDILLQMSETSPHIEGTNAREETDGFIFHFDRWATNPWFCYVERK